MMIKKTPMINTNNNRVMLMLVLMFYLMALPVMAQQPVEDSAAEASAKTVFPGQLPDHYPSLQRLSLQAFAEQNYAQAERITEHTLNLRPYDGSLMAQLVVAYALQEKRTKAYNLMLVMQQQGLWYDFDAFAQTEVIRDTQSYEYINDLLKQAGEPLVTSTTAFSLPADSVLPEAIAWDAKNSQFLIGTVRDATIRVLDSNGQPVESAPKFVIEDAMSVFDIAIDNGRRELWASTTAVGQQKGYKQADYGNNALLKFDLDSGELKAQYSISPDGQPHGLGSLVVASDGTVYVADLRSPLVYTLAAGSDKLTILAGGSALPNIRGIALNESNNLLYLADQVRGLAFIDLNDRKPYLLNSQPNLNLGGIEGLDYWNGHLVIIQPGIRPTRSMQLLLSTDGRSAVSSIPLDANHPSYHAPNYGVVAGDHYYYMAASHWTAFDLNGNRLPGSSLQPVPVLKAALQNVDPNANKRPDLQDVVSRHQQQRQGATQAPPELLARPEQSQEQSDG